MTGNQKILVLLELEGSEIEVGELVSDGKKIFFRYYPSFVDGGLEISPLKLPLNEKTHSADPIPFEGLFGVFNDSLPDGWGRLLVDRHLGNQGIALNSVTPLDRLAYAGEHGAGALIYRPSLEIEQPKRILNLDDVSKQVKQVLDGSDEEVIEKLFPFGGSSGGARPKINVGFNPKENQLIYGLNDLPDGYEDWIIKFPSAHDYKDIAEMEYAYYKMAIIAGIQMSECKLFTGKSGKKYFGTKRFDRIETGKLHMHSAAGLLHDDFRRSSLDYGHLMDAGFRLTKQASVYEDILRLAAFNVYTHNRDDHSKNFSFLMDAKGKWIFSPAYDLTFSTSSHGLHSTSVAGESKSPGRKNLMELADEFLVKKATKIIDEVQDALIEWRACAKQAGVSAKTTTLIWETIREGVH